jgi:hypothetical protein
MFKRFGRWLKTHKLVIAITVIVALVLGFFTYQKIALELNKRAFAQARTAIDTIYADIVSQTGVPDEYQRPNSCSRAHQEFTQGPLSCDINSNFIYGVGNEAEANNLFKKIQRIINSHSTFSPLRHLSTSISDTLVVNTYYHASSDRYRSYGLDCVVNYIFDTPREIDLKIKDPSKKPFEITIGCFSLARSQYYPLAY